MGGKREREREREPSSSSRLRYLKVMEGFSPFLYSATSQTTLSKPLNPPGGGKEKKKKTKKDQNDIYHGN